MKTLAKLASLTFAAVALVLAGCGSTMEERAATGAVGGAVVAGPVGAAVGAAGGAAVSKAANEPAK
jgi:osmotically inducible lipoprotein OsmB